MDRGTRDRASAAGSSHDPHQRQQQEQEGGEELRQQATAPKERQAASHDDHRLQQHEGHHDREISVKLQLMLQGKSRIEESIRQQVQLVRLSRSLNHSIL